MVKFCTLTLVIDSLNSMSGRNILNSILLIAVIFRMGLSQDTTSYIEGASTLIKNKQFAKANNFLQSAIQKSGFQPDLVCMQIGNVLKNYFFQDDHISFYLRDSTGAAGAKDPVVSYLWYPDRILKRVIEQYPDYGEAYKLLGDFHQLKLQYDVDSTLLNANMVTEIRGKIFLNYNKAFQLGYNHPYLNRWLGDYYKAKGQFQNAKTFYQKNVESGFNDALTFYQLADISFKEKQYSQSYNFASKALPLLPVAHPEIKYSTLKIAALSLFNLGEADRFKKYINQCIQLFPDKQETYIALLNYYDDNKDVDKMEEIIIKMLNSNPYNLRGYNYLEDFILKYEKFLFSEQLFENMILRYDYSDQVMGNIYWYRGNILFHQGMTEEARKLWEISRSYFAKFLKADDPIFKKIGDITQKSLAN